MTVPTIVGTPPYQNKSTSSLTLAGPTCQAGDLVFVLVMCIQTESLLATTGANPPNIAATDSPYTQVSGSPWSDATSNKKLYLFWARATGTSIPAAQTSDPTTLVQYCVIVVRGGLSSGTPYEQLTGGTDTTADTTTTIPGITTQGPDRLVIGGVTTNFDGIAAQWSAWTNANLDLTAPRGEQGDQCTNTGSGTVPGGLGAYAGGKASQGATGNTTATLANASRNVYCHFAVIPLASQSVQLASAITETDTLYTITPHKPKVIQLSSSISETDVLYALKVNPQRRLVKRIVTTVAYGEGAYGVGPYGIGSDTDTENDIIYALKVNPQRRLVRRLAIDSTYATGNYGAFLYGGESSDSEIDRVYSITPQKSTGSKVVTLSSCIAETDSLYALKVSPQRRFVNLINETDVLYAFKLNPIRRLVNLINETDVLYAFKLNPIRRLINLINETDVLYALKLNPIRRLVNLVSEIDTLYALKVNPIRRLVNLISETNTIYSIIPSKIKTLGTITETDDISAITQRKSRVVGTFTETDSVSTISRYKSRSVNIFTETDSIYSLKVGPLRRLVHTITETDSVWAISTSGLKRINVGLVTETDSVYSVKINPQHRLLNTITESETIHSISSCKSRIVDTITEIDSVYSITPFGVHYPSTRPGPDYLTLDSGKINELSLDENHNAFLGLIARTTSPELIARTTSPELTVRTTSLTVNVNHLTGVTIDENHTGYLVLISRETSPGLNAPNKELILDG